MPLDETAALAPQSPYGENKLEIERMLAELESRDRAWLQVGLGKPWGQSPLS